MKLLVLTTSDLPVSKDLLSTQIHDDIEVNSYPKGDGIAIVDQGQPIDWSWPTAVVRVGPLEVGRHHVDATLDPASDIESQIIDLYEQTTESESNEDMLAG
jgi:hypothetical protein